MNIFELAAIASLGGGAISGAMAGLFTGGIMAAVCGLVLGLAVGLGIHFGIPVAICRLSRKYNIDSAKKFSKFILTLTLIWACAAPFLSMLITASVMIAIFSKSV